MKISRLILIVIVVIISAWTVESNSSLKKSKNILMISIDGLRPDFYLSNEFNTPKLKELVQSGAYATGSIPVFPSVTYPNHTSLITGVPPAEHKILSNTIFTWEKGPEPGWYWESSHIKTPTLLDIAHSKGLTVAAVRWPVTLGAKLNILVPEIFGMKNYYEGDDWELTVKFTDPKLMDELLSHTSLKGYKNEEEMDHWVSEASAYILKKYNPHLMAIHLANVDHIAHESGVNNPEIIKAVSDADKNIAKIVSAVDMKKTCVFIVGDHGFYDVTKKISPNTLFVKKGWIQLDDKNQIKDWTVIAHASGGQAAIYTKNLKLVSEIDKLLKEYSLTNFKVINKSDLKKMGSYPEAVLAISANEGFTVSNDLTGELISPTSVKGQHGHLPDNPKLHTGFIAAGCGIKKNQNLGVISNLSIAPTIAKILGIKLKKSRSNVLPIDGL